MDSSMKSGGRSARSCKLLPDQTQTDLLWLPATSPFSPEYCHHGRPGCRATGSTAGGTRRPIARFEVLEATAFNSASALSARSLATKLARAADAAPLSLLCQIQPNAVLFTAANAGK